MVRKITSGEYLKRVDNMTATERHEYLNRVGDWLSVSGQSLTKKGDVFEARMQNVLQVSVGWNDQECAAFEEGAVLLSALVGVADTKLPELLYAISAKRSIKRMFQLLWETEAGAGWTDISGGTAEHLKGHTGKGGGTAEHPDSHTGKGGGTAGEPADTVAENDGEPADTVAGNAGEPADTVAGNDGEPADTVAGNDAEAAGTAAVPVRPKHIDQYVHLLPKKTQEHAALVQELYREMDVAREKLRLLMNDATASAADREAWAKKVTKCDNTLRKIFDELDAEWAKLVKEGRVVVDDLGNARVIAAADAAGTVAQGSKRTDGEPADTVAGNAGEPADTVAQGGGRTIGHPEDNGRTAGHPEDGGLTSEQKARRRELRKWLVDTRRGNGGSREERVKKWYENFREYLTLEGDAAYEDEKIKEAIEHYGIDVEKLRR